MNLGGRSAMAQWYNVIIEVKRVAGSRLTGDTVGPLLCPLLSICSTKGGRKSSCHD